MRKMRRAGRRLLRRSGWDVVRIGPLWPGDFSPEEIALYEEVAPYTMTSSAAIVTLSAAVQYIVKAEKPGAFVECGVWKGGSMMAIARTLCNLGRMDADLYLFDTFEGMTSPGKHDVNRSGRPAQALLDEDHEVDTSLLWARAPMEAVQAAMATIPYPTDRLHFTKGPVETTLPDAAPDQIALLRLDTDWYESTRHELEHLYPRLVPGGVLIIDDYGWWGGARKATDEYFEGRTDVPFLMRVDDSGRRMAIKLPA